MKRKLIILFATLCFYTIFVNAQVPSKEYSKQNRISFFCAKNYDLEMSKWYSMKLPNFDIRYRITNYSNELDYFSFTGKFGILGFNAYLHFGPEVKFLEMFYINSTFGMYLGYIGIGLISETELGFKKNIFKQLYIEGGGSWQLFTPDIKKFTIIPSLKIGLGIDL